MFCENLIEAIKVNTISRLKTTPKKILNLFLIVAFVGMTACIRHDKISPYTLNCPYSKDHVVIDDDTYMHMASKFIYDHLEAKEQLQLQILPKGATPHTLYHMYLSPDVYLKFNVIHWNYGDPPRSSIRVRFKPKDAYRESLSLTAAKNKLLDDVVYKIDFQHCGEVTVRSVGGKTQKEIESSHMKKE